MKIPVLNKDFQLIIPTHERPTLKDQKTWRGLPKSLREQCLIITSTKKDRNLLREALEHEHVYAINDKSVDGIAKKRQWIIENIKSDYIVQMDDDLTFQHRCPKRFRHLVGSGSNGQWKMKPKYQETHKFIEIDKFKDHLKELAWEIFLNRIQSKGYAHGGLGPRMGNNNERDEYRVNGRVMQCMVHHRKTLLKRGIRFDDVLLREDFHVSMSLLKLGYPNLISTKFLVNADPFGKKGGCFNERTIEMSNEQAEVLAELHSPYIKAVEKKYRGVTNIPRIEVVCYWQKGYQSAKKKERYV